MNMMEEARKQVSALTQAAYAHAVEKGVLPAGAAVEAKVEVPKDVKNGRLVYLLCFGRRQATGAKSPPGGPDPGGGIGPDGQLLLQGSGGRTGLFELYSGRKVVWRGALRY